MKRIILILAALCVLLCGCGENEQVVLRMVCWGNSDEEKILKDDIEDFYESALEGWGRYKDVTYCIPTDIDGLRMYCNKKMFDEAVPLINKFLKGEK